MISPSANSDTAFPIIPASLSLTLDQAGAFTTSIGTSHGRLQEACHHATADDFDVELQPHNSTRTSSNTFSVISPPLEKRSFSSGDGIRRNDGRSDAKNMFVGNEDDSLGPRSPKDVRKFTNRVGQEKHGENGLAQLHSAHDTTPHLREPLTSSAESSQTKRQDDTAVPTFMNPGFHQSHLVEDQASHQIRQMSLPGRVRGQQDRNDYSSSQQTHEPVASFPLAPSTSPHPATQASSHNSLGNRISTFFGGHRPSPRASTKRPSTSPGLMGGSSGITWVKNNNQVEKRSLFGRSLNDKSRPIPDHVKSLRPTSGLLGIQHDDIPPRTEYQQTLETDYLPSPRQKLDILRPSTSISDSKVLPPGLDKERAIDSVSNKFHPASTNKSVEQMETDASASRLAGNGQNNSYYQPRADTAVQTIPADFRKDYTDHYLDHEQPSSDPGQSYSTLHSEHPSAAPLPAHAKLDMSPTISGEAAVTTPVNEWNMWGSPSNGTSRTYPHLKKQRQERFSWEVNPSLPDGRQMMGFGGDLGKKRLLTSQAAGANMSLSPSLGSGEDVDEKHLLPYILGYEKHVLAFEPLIQDAFFSVAGNTHTFYPEASAPPKRVLDIGTGVGAWPIAMAQQWRDTTFIGLDIAPVQTDLSALATAEEMFSLEFPEEPESTSKISWQDIASRVTWRIGDFLQDLPFDTGSFDMVHIRFVGLGVPETSWSSVFSEATRVLKPDTGILEIVEMSKILPSATPHSLKASFASLMLSSFINQHPFIPIRPALAMSELTVNEIFNVDIRRSEIGHDDPPNVLLQTMGVWVDSALGKGKHGRGKGMSGNTYGALSKAPVSAMQMPKWGEGVMGEQALKQLCHHAEDRQLSKSDEAPSAGLVSDKLAGQVRGRRDSRSTSQSNDPPEDDEVNLVVWIAKRKM